MSSSQRPKEDEASFADVLDLGSVPPPPGVVGPDVHAARTAIAAMPTTLLEELRRAKAEAKRSSFTNEAPTRPGKEGMRLLRPLAPDVNDPPPSPPSSDLASAITQIIATSKEAVTEAPPPLPVPPLAPPPPPPQVVKTPPMPIAAPVLSAPVPFLPLMPDPPPQEEPRPLVRIELLVAFVVVVGTGLVFALLAIADRLLSHR